MNICIPNITLYRNPGVVGNVSQDKMNYHQTVTASVSTLIPNGIVCHKRKKHELAYSSFKNTIPINSKT